MLHWMHWIHWIYNTFVWLINFQIFWFMMENFQFKTLVSHNCQSSHNLICSGKWADCHCINRARAIHQFLHSIYYSIWLNIVLSEGIRHTCNLCILYFYMYEWIWWIVAEIDHLQKGLSKCYKLQFKHERCYRRKEDIYKWMN